MAFETSITGTGLEAIILLKDLATGYEAEVFAFGAILNKYGIRNEQGFVNIVDGFANPEDAIQNITPAFKSAKLSPFVCRLDKGKYKWLEKEFQVEKYFLGDHIIHGLVYDALFSIDSYSSTDNEASVTLKYLYNESHLGYPYSFELIITWTLSKGGALTATTNVIHYNEHAIPYADGWHPYFTLNDSVDNCTLQMNSIQMVEFDEGLIPTGKIIEDYRFLEGTNLKGIELDNCFLLKDSSHSCCVFKNNSYSLTINPDKAYPYLQVYIPPHRNSIAIENLSGAPDNFNNQMGLLSLLPNTNYQFKTSYLLNVL